MLIFNSIIQMLYFIIVVPFIENFIFSSFIVIIFLFNLYNNKRKHQILLDEYYNNVDNLIYNEWNEAKVSHGIPGVLMSLGIIGTFYLIYSSLITFEINDIEKVSTIITLSIAPAFSISAFGIFMSVMYIFIERIFIIKPYESGMKSIEKSKDSITYVDISTKQLKLLKNILDINKKQVDIFSSLDKFSTSLYTASESMQKFGSIAETLDKTLNPEILGEVISKAVNKEMLPILLNIQKITENVDDNSNKITQFLEIELKNEIVIPLKDSVENTTKALSNIENTLEKTTNAMIETNKGFDKLNGSLLQFEFSQSKFIKQLDSVLDKQKEEFEKTSKNISTTYKLLTDNINNQMNVFNENSGYITEAFKGLSKEMQEFLIDYKNDYRELLKHQEEAIKTTTNKAVEILKNAGEESSNVINKASSQLQSTLGGVDEALVKTSKSIKDELENFKNSYTESLTGFLNSQEDILNSVFKVQTEKLAGVVNNFRENLENDVTNRKLLNDDLEKLISTTNGFVSSTQAMLTTGFNEQQNQLISFIETNKKMQSRISNLLDNISNINENGNRLTKELIDTTANLQKQFNDNQIEVLQKYQISVDEHLKDILNYMASIIEASHIDKEK